MTMPDVEATSPRPPLHPDPVAAPRSERKRIARTRRAVLRDLTSAERSTLIADAYAIYSSYKQGVDLATFERRFFTDRDTRVASFHREDGAVVGFYSVSTQRLAHSGQEHLVVNGPCFVDTKYDGTREATMNALLDAILIKLREPSKSVAYLGVMTSPASYRLVAAGMPRMFPSRRAPTPAWINEVVREAAEQRGLTFVDESRWLVNGSGVPSQPERLKRSRRLQSDPDARFYTDQNPDFEHGTAMLVWLPLDLKNLCGAFVRRLVTLSRGRRL